MISLFLTNKIINPRTLISVVNLFRISKGSLSRYILAKRKANDKRQQTCGLSKRKTIDFHIKPLTVQIICECLLLIFLKTSLTLNNKSYKV